MNPFVASAALLLAVGAVPSLAFGWGVFTLGSLAARLRSPKPAERVGALVELVLESPELYPQLAPRLEEAIAARDSA